MAIKEKLMADFKDAMKAKDEVAKNTTCLIILCHSKSKSAFQNYDRKIKAEKWISPHSTPPSAFSFRTHNKDMIQLLFNREWGIYF